MRASPRSHRVSVIVPVLDEEASIDRLLAQLHANAGDAEILVVDGGSRDETVARAERHAGVRVIRSERGRARQMNAGAREASGEVLLFLHADTVLPAGALDRVRDAVAGGADFGCFTVKIESDDLRLRIASRMISARSRLMPSSTGDQAQFFRRELFFSIGGYPDVPLFEDMMIVGLAARRGRYRCVDGPVRTSARRWQAHGISRTMIRMLALRTLYHLGVAPQTLAKFYATHPR